MVADSETTSLQVDEAEYETIRVDSKIVTDLKAYLLTEVLPYLTELPDYDDSEEFRDEVLSKWIGEAIRQGLEEEGYFS